MIDIVLYQPEIPPNTGNIIRLCANTQAQLHLIHPLGFDLNDKQLRRAGLDYREWVDVQQYDHLSDYCTAHPNTPLIACSTHGKTRYDCYPYRSFSKIALLFGPETRGLPSPLISEHPSIFIPMTSYSRSLNLSNSVAIILYEVLRQHHFKS